MSAVVKLPTAARRKVDNSRFAEQRRASQAAKRSGEWPGEYRDPQERAMDEWAELLLSIEQTPVTELLMAIAAALTDEQRIKTVEVLAPGVAGGRRSAKQALALLLSAKMTVGQQHYLGRAMNRAQQRER